jgi:hypothetical protein
MVAYELNLPLGWKTHNVVHVSLVRKILFNPNQLLAKLLQPLIGEILVE